MEKEAKQCNVPKHRCVKIPTEKGGPTLAIAGTPIPVASATLHLMRFEHVRRGLLCAEHAKSTVEPYHGS